MLSRETIIINELWNRFDDLYKKIKTLGDFSEDIKEIKNLLLILKNKDNEKYL